MIEQVKAILAESPNRNFERGIHARFFRINQKWGFKFYNHRGDAMANLKSQQFAAMAGVGCKCGDSIEEVVWSGDHGPQKWYGFITECVAVTGKEMCRRRFFPELMLDKMPGMYTCYEKMNSIISLKKQSAFMTKCKRRGVRVSDWHWGNYGWLGFYKNGNPKDLRLIDFSCD